jgi:hypothetical protein
MLMNRVFLAGVGKHIGEQAAQVGELLPFIPRHFAQHVALAVNHLVVGEGQHEVFVKAYQMLKVTLFWWNCRNQGSMLK